MSWQDQDNKKQRGKIDRIYVSPTEYYELHHYVDHYLQSNAFDVSDKNRQTVSLSFCCTGRGIWVSDGICFLANCCDCTISIV